MGKIKKIKEASIEIFEKDEIIPGLIFYILNDEIYIDKDFIFLQISKKSRIDLLPITINHKAKPCTKAFSIYQILAMIQRLSYSDYEKALELLNLCEKIIKEFSTLNDFKTFQWWRDAVSFSAIHTMKCLYSERESNGIQARFKDSINNLNPNAKIINDYKFNKSNVPDFMINIGGLIRPVEIKKGKATGSAIKQISRYINFYNADKGYLVAPKTSVTMPDNVIFVKFN